MKTKIKILQADLFNVLIEGCSNDQQKARVFFLLFVPLYTVYTIVGKVK
ncbi:MAG: hypothetical protein ABIN95_09725 [Mucilaginibacter sp.]